jgi:hypothetical protein
MWGQLKANEGFDCNLLDWIRDHRAGMKFDDVGVMQTLTLGRKRYLELAEVVFDFWVQAMTPGEGRRARYWSKEKNWEKGMLAQVEDDLAEMWASVRGRDWFERKCGPALRQLIEPLRQKLSSLVRDTAIALIDAAEAKRQLALLQEQSQQQQSPDTGSGMLEAVSSRAVSPASSPAAAAAASGPSSPNAPGEATPKIEQTQAAHSARRPQKQKIKQFMADCEIKTMAAAAKALSVGLDILKSISRGDDRHADDTEKRVLNTMAELRAEFRANKNKPRP